MPNVSTQVNLSLLEGRQKITLLVINSKNNKGKYFTKLLL